MAVRDSSSATATPSTTASEDRDVDLVARLIALSLDGYMAADKGSLVHRDQVDSPVLPRAGFPNLIELWDCLAELQDEVLELVPVKFQQVFHTVKAHQRIGLSGIVDDVPRR